MTQIPGLRRVKGTSAAQIANAGGGLIRGEQALRRRVPTLKIEYNTDIRIPEIIGPDAEQGRAFLTSRTTPPGSKHADVLINFLKQNTELVGSDSKQIDAFKVAADYTNPDRNPTLLELDQEIN